MALLKHRSSEPVCEERSVFLKNLIIWEWACGATLPGLMENEDRQAAHRLPQPLGQPAIEFSR